MCFLKKDNNFRWLHLILCPLFSDTEEITVWIQQVYRNYALDDAEERFPEYDTDNNGVVTWEEYNMVAHGQLINFDDNPVMEDVEEESIRHVCLQVL